MDLEQPKEESVKPQPSATTPSSSKRPDRPHYVPKKRQEASKDKPQTQEETKPRPRPRYTDKARKNAKNKKDKAVGGDETAPDGGGGGGGEEDGGETQNGVTKPDKKEERLEDVAETQNDGQSSSSIQGADIEDSSCLEAPPSEPEEEEGESWDTLFNDDGEYLDPHVFEEVSVLCYIWSCIVFFVRPSIKIFSRNAWDRTMEQKPECSLGLWNKNESIAWTLKGSGFLPFSSTMSVGLSVKFCSHVTQ